MRIKHNKLYRYIAYEWSKLQVDCSPLTRGPNYKVREIIEVTSLPSGLKLHWGCFRPSRQMDPATSEIDDIVGLPSTRASMGPRRVAILDRVRGGFTDVSHLAEVGLRTSFEVDPPMCDASLRLVLGPRLGWIPQCVTSYRGWFPDLVRGGSPDVSCLVKVDPGSRSGCPPTLCVSLAEVIVSPR